MPLLLLPNVRLHGVLLLLLLEMLRRRVQHDWWTT
jgi:hypothetical protein